jgi:hypothetical protein
MTATTDLIEALAGEVLAGDDGAALALRDLLEERQTAEALAGLYRRVCRRIDEIVEEQDEAFALIADGGWYGDAATREDGYRRLDATGKAREEEGRLWDAVEPLLEVCPLCEGDHYSPEEDEHCPRCVLGRVLPDDGAVTSRRRNREGVPA